MEQSTIILSDMDPTLQKFREIEARIKEVREAMLKMHLTFGDCKSDPDCKPLFTMMYGQGVTSEMDEHLKIMLYGVQIQIKEFENTKGMTTQEKGMYFLKRGLNPSE